jgi:hypothetical protein
MKLKKHRIIYRLQNGYVLCKADFKHYNLKSNSYTNFYWLYNPKTKHSIDDIDMRSVPSILKMCKVDSKGNYELQQIFK